jgi:hypothetical protein
VLSGDAPYGAVICRSARVAKDGTRIPQEQELPEGDLFRVLARYPPFHVHACIVRSALVRAVGCFDTSLERCPDWDLWQRVARTGARFAAVDETLAFYRMSPAGISLDADRMLRDSLTILRRGHAPDPRVAAPSAEHANGVPSDQIPTQAFYLLAWCAGLLLGADRDARDLLGMLRDMRFPDLWPPSVADCILEAAPLSACTTASQWAAGDKSRFVSLATLFLHALERHSGTPALADRVLNDLGPRLDALREGAGRVSAGR